MTREDAFAGCKAVDTATTLKIIKVGGTELNPIAGTFLHYGVFPFIAMQVAVVWAFYAFADHLSDEAKTLVTVAGCAPAAHNLAEMVP